jgi:DNA-directed RNA polymerase subunit RPC12/RpoP
MEIKRKLNMVLKTDRRFVIRHAQNIEQMECPECDSKMLVAEKVAALFGLAQRRIFQFIEKGDVHFIETETSSVMVCLSSTSAVSTSDLLILPAKE